MKASQQLEWTPGLLLAFIARFQHRTRGSPVFSLDDRDDPRHKDWLVDFAVFVEAADVVREWRHLVASAFGNCYPVLRMAGLVAVRSSLDNTNPNRYLDAVVTKRGEDLVRELSLDVELELVMGDELAKLVSV